MTKRYAYVFFGSAIVLIGLLVGYGFYVNSTSSAHVAKMAASQYFRVRGAVVQYRDMSPMVLFPTINVYSPKMSDVHFEIDGTLVQVYVKPGDRVRAGQLLGEIINKELPAEMLQAEGKIRAAEANVIKWEHTLQRYQSLIANNAISRQQMDEAVTSLRAAEGELTSARGYHGQVASRLGGQQIVAPYDGDILQVYHAPGATVRAGGSLAMIGELTSLYFRNNVASEVLEQLQPLTDVFKLAVKSNAVVEKAYASTIKAGGNAGEKDNDLHIAEVSPPLDTPARYRTVVYEINNSTGLLEPGTYYQVKIYGTSKRRVLSVPKDCVRGDTEPYVLVVSPGDRLERRQIKTGINDDAYVEVQSGLQENEMVALASVDDEYIDGMQVRVIQTQGVTP